jgi:hypothetical protein
MTAPTLTILNNLKAALAALPGLATCKIGLEADMAPSDYPMVRIVPTRLLPARTLGRRRIDALVYFGAPVHEFEERPAGEPQRLEAVYADLLEMEELIISLAGSSPFFTAVHVETIMDEDQVADAFKLMALRFDIEG